MKAKKILAAILALAMVLTVVAVPAFADYVDDEGIWHMDPGTGGVIIGEDGEPILDITDPNSEVVDEILVFYDVKVTDNNGSPVGGSEGRYDTLAEALDVATDGDTIALLRNVKIEDSIVIANGKNVILDLNGKHMTASATYAIRVEGELEVKDSVAPGGKISGTGYAIDVAPSGKLNFINGTTNGIMILGYQPSDKWAAGYGKAGTANISGGVHTTAGLQVTGEATMSVTGGKFEEITTSPIYDGNSKALKTTGFVTGAYSKQKTNHWGKGNVYDPIPVEGYEFIELSSSSTGDELAAFNEGYLYRVRAIPVVPVAKIEGKEYMTLDAAISDVANGQTIQVISDIQSKTGFNINKTDVAFTIDLGDNKVQIINDESWAFTLNAGTVTIQNGYIESNYAIQNLGGTLNLTNLSIDCDNGVYSNSDSAVTAITKCSINGGWGLYGIDVIKGSMTIVDGEYDVNGITVNEKNNASLTISGSPRFGNNVVLDYNWIADGYLIQLVGECGIDEHEDEGWTVLWKWMTSYLEPTDKKYARATVGGVEQDFIELQEAIDKADEGTTVTVLNSVDLGYTIQINKSLTLDLNGCEVTSKAAVWVEGENIDVTIKGGTIKVNVLISYVNTSDGINVGEGAKLTLDNVKLYPDGNFAIQAGDYFGGDVGFVEIKGSETLIDTKGEKVNGRFAVSDVGGSYLKITGGTFDADPTLYVPEGYSVTDNDDGTWTVRKTTSEPEVKVEKPDFVDDEAIEVIVPEGEEVTDDIKNELTEIVTNNKTVNEFKNTGIVELVEDMGESRIKTLLKDATNNEAVKALIDSQKEFSQDIKVKFKGTEIKAIQESVTTYNRIDFNVTPTLETTVIDEKGNKTTVETIIPNTDITEELTFLLPVPFKENTIVEVLHKGEHFANAIVEKGTDEKNYVRIKSKEFSVYSCLAKGDITWSYAYDSGKYGDGLGVVRFLFDSGIPDELVKYSKVVFFNFDNVGNSENSSIFVENADGYGTFSADLIGLNPEDKTPIYARGYIQAEAGGQNFNFWSEADNPYTPKFEKNLADYTPAQ